MIAASIRRHPDSQQPNDPWFISYAILPDHGQHIGSKSFGTVTAPTLDDVVPTIAETTGQKDLCLAVYRPVIFVEEIPATKGASSREITKALKTRAESLQLESRDDVRFLHGTHTDGSSCDVVAGIQNRYQQTLTRGPMKMRRLNYIAYGWAHAATDSTVILDASQASAGWVELTILTQPLAHTVQLKTDVPDLAGTIEDQILGAIQQKFLHEPPAVIHVVDPLHIIWQSALAGSPVAPLPAALPVQFAEYVPILGVAKYRL
jgi:hypothetical protein